MKRRIFFLIAVLLVASGLFLLVRVIYSFRDVGKGGLQVTSNVKGKVLLNGELIGEIPVRKLSQQDTLPVGNYELRIEPEETSLAAYTVRIKINSGVLTAVDKTFLPGSLGSAYVLTLEKSSSPKPQLEITSIPDGALVTIDSVALGTTPYKTDTLSASEHEIEVQKEGFAKKTIRIRAVDKHILVVNAVLGTGDADTTPLTTPTGIQPTVSISPTQAIVSKITILQTPNGFLRVRSGAGTSFSEVARIKPGETYDLIMEQAGWYQIKIDETTSGWISSQFSRKE